MNRQTQVKEIKVRSRMEKWIPSNAELTEIEQTETPLVTRFLQLDHLVRNFAVVAALVLVTVAVRSSEAPEVQSVFGALQKSAGMQWDESIGKLSFVNSLLPEEIQAVWNESGARSVFAPVAGTFVHAWSASEPYILMESSATRVNAAADGEVMSIAHGLEEERILRIRHEGGVETIYGNLKSCTLDIGQQVQAGEEIGQRLSGQPLAFEMKVDGRSVQPAFE